MWMKQENRRRFPRAIEIINNFVRVYVSSLEEKRKKRT
jgi:hypothetical protein